MKKKLFPFLLMLVLCAPAVAAGQQSCMTEEIARRNLDRFPELARRSAALHQAIAGLATKDEGPGLREVLRIPVVVHVVYNGSLENISDAQIQSQIDVLNNDYRLLNANASSIPAAFQPFAADVGLEFCLAGIDPQGQPTNGITRTATTWLNIGQIQAPDGSPRICYTALGGHDAWAPDQYLNIWVAGIGGGILGFGTLPGTAPPEEEGVVIDPRYFGTTGLAALFPPHHLGRTATHEIGHYLGLFHIWGGNENVCNDDDEVDDTPVQRGPYFGCPAYPQYSCGNSVMFMNYMDYTDDACMSFFTLGQKARMWATLNVVHPGLLGSLACVSSAVQEPLPASGFIMNPNPAGSTVQLQTSFGAPEKAWAALPDGRSVPLDLLPQGDNQLTLSLSGLGSGIFMIFLQDENGTIYRGKLVRL
ncbi:MAG TPA: M43 family zinc metalloprotease [Saprospiraceae bacterium]|nr:M43 family zinc metalloprotease [Saprospiraceae bacterium]